MKQAKIYEFDPVIYPRKLWIAVDVPECVIKQKFGTDIHPLAETALAETAKYYDSKRKLGGILIRFKNIEQLNFRITTHESIHAASDILEYCGFNLDYNNQEPVCYLADWIADCIAQVKNKISEINESL